MDKLVLSTIRDAIINHRQLTLTLTNDDGVKRHRVVSPHILGTKEDEWHLLAWQINDDSRTGFKPGAPRWRCLELHDMSDVASQDGEWHRGWVTGRGKQWCVDVIDTVVDDDYAAEVQNTSRERIR